jgi:dCMP deaminase
MSRPSWDSYFMEITRVVATRSTCLRRQVGALIVRDKRILSSGYNGSPRGLGHCADLGCLREELGIPSGERQELCRGLHAEQNAIVHAAYHGINISDSTLYVTHQPCITCAKMIVNAGIIAVIFAGEYPDRYSVDLLAQAGIELKPFSSL